MRCFDTVFIISVYFCIPFLHTQQRNSRNRHSRNSNKRANINCCKQRESENKKIPKRSGFNNLSLEQHLKVYFIFHVVVKFQVRPLTLLVRLAKCNFCMFVFFSRSLPGMIIIILYFYCQRLQNVVYDKVFVTHTHHFTCEILSIHHE